MSHCSNSKNIQSGKTLDDYVNGARGTIRKSGDNLAKFDAAQEVSIHIFSHLNIIGEDEYESVTFFYFYLIRCGFEVWTPLQLLVQSLCVYKSRQCCFNFSYILIFRFLVMYMIHIIYTPYLYVCITLFLIMNVCLMHTITLLVRHRMSF